MKKKKTIIGVISIMTLLLGCAPAGLASSATATSVPYPTEIRLGNLIPAFYEIFASPQEVAESQWSAFRPMTDYLIQALSREGLIIRSGTPEQKYADFKARGYELRGYSAENGEGSAFVVFDPKTNAFFDPTINGQPELDLMISNDYINTHDTGDISMGLRKVSGTELKFLSRWPIVLNNDRTTWQNLDNQLEMVVSIPTAVPESTTTPEALYASISTMDQMRTYVEKTWKEFAANPDMELKAG